MRFLRDAIAGRCLGTNSPDFFGVAATFSSPPFATTLQALQPLNLRAQVGAQYSGKVGGRRGHGSGSKGGLSPARSSSSVTEP